jgi:hypothetical protein
MSKNKIVWNFLRISVVVFMVTSFLGCVAAIPVAVMYYKGKENYVAKADLPAPAQKVYSTAVSMAEEKEVNIIEQDDKNLLVKVTDGKQTASLKAVPVSSDKTEITVTASIPEAEERKEEQKELALRIIDNVCAKLDVKCTITKQ